MVLESRGSAGIDHKMVAHSTNRGSADLP